MVPQPEPRCPLCGGPNDCVPAACGRFDTACWCREVHITPAVLARIAPAQRDRACICRGCAESAATTPAAQAGSADDDRAGGTTATSASCCSNSAADIGRPNR
ncbi:MAG: hypothetical protein RL654_2983 [Pseudomonadota bacterium]